MSKFEDLLEFQFYALQYLGKDSARRAMNYIYRLQNTSDYILTNEILRYSDKNTRDMFSSERNSIEKEFAYISDRKLTILNKFIDRMTGGKRGSINFYSKYFNIVVSEDYFIRHFDIIAYALMLKIHGFYSTAFTNLPKFMYISEHSKNISPYLYKRSTKENNLYPVVVMSDRVWFLMIAICNFLASHQYDETGNVKKINFEESKDDLNDLAGFFKKISEGEYVYPPMKSAKRAETIDLVIGLSTYLIGHEMRHFDIRHNRVDGIGQNAELEADIDGIAAAIMICRSSRYADSIPLFLMLTSMILIGNPVKSLKDENEQYPSVMTRFRFIILRFKEYIDRDKMLEVIDNAERIARFINPAATNMDLS